MPLLPRLEVLKLWVSGALNLEPLRNPPKQVLWGQKLVLGEEGDRGELVSPGWSISEDDRVSMRLSVLEDDVPYWRSIPIFVELRNNTDRTDDCVKLRNRSSKLLLRVQTDRGFWRREADADWTAWCHGRWVAPDEVPAVSVAPPREHQVRLAYFVPSDRRPVSNYEEKMRVVMAFVTALVRSDLQAKGYKTDGVSLESDGGKAVVHLLRGARPAAHYNTGPEYDIAEQWLRLVPEIRASLGDTRHQVIVVLAETYDDGPARFLWPGAIACGAYYSADGGLAVYSAHILRDEFCALTVEAQRPLFFDRMPIVGRTALGHGPDSPRCEFVEDGFGAVAHGLGHALGLMHDLRQARPL